jgi:GntR family phosphonate transport system transcriptional regulator
MSRRPIQVLGTPAPPPMVPVSVPLPPLAQSAPGQERSGRGANAMWRQIASALRDPIEKGDWPRGARLPIEVELAAHFRVNRHTVRRALADLSRDGLIETTQGRGTFVTAGEKVRYRLDGQNPIADEGWPGVQLLSSSLVGQGVVEAGGRLGSMLSLPPSRRLCQMDLRLDADGVPVALVSIWVEQEGFARFADTFRRVGSLQKTLSDYGHNRFRTLTSAVSARMADERECGLLRTKPEALLTVVETVAQSVREDRPATPTFVLHTALCSARVDLQVVHTAPAS